MVELKLTSRNPALLKPMVKAALDAERRELRAALLKTQEKLSAFERQYRRSTASFLSRRRPIPHLNELNAVEWAGEHATLQRIKAQLSKTVDLPIGQSSADVSTNIPG